MKHLFINHLLLLSSFLATKPQQIAIFLCFENLLHKKQNLPSIHFFLPRKLQDKIILQRCFQHKRSEAMTVLSFLAVNIDSVRNGFGKVQGLWEKVTRLSGKRNWKTKVDVYRQKEFQKLKLVALCQRTGRNCLFAYILLNSHTVYVQLIY